MDFGGVCFLGMSDLYATKINLTMVLFVTRIQSHTNRRKSPMKTRPYRVTNMPTGKVRLIEGVNVSQVARFITATEYLIVPANSMDALRLIADQGVKLESAMTPKAVV